MEWVSSDNYVQFKGEMTAYLILWECDVHVIVEPMVEHVHRFLAQLRNAPRRHRIRQGDQGRDEDEVKPWWYIEIRPGVGVPRSTQPGLGPSQWHHRCYEKNDGM
jgi:hypothetical protein